MEPQYRSLSGWAVLSVAVGLFAPLVAVDWAFLLIPAAGVAAAQLALRGIARAPDALAGAGLARFGRALCIVLGLAGAAWLATSKAREAPRGYIPVSYEELKADAASGELYPARATELDGKKIFVKGYMYPGKVQINLRQFLVSRDNGSCEFCTPNPTPSDLIHVTLVGDLRFDYTSRLVSLGGTLRVETDPDRLARDGVAYHLDVDYIR